MNDFSIANILESLLSVLGGGWATVGAAVAIALLGSILYFWLSSKLNKWRQEQDRKTRTEKEGSQVRELKERLSDRHQKNSEAKRRLEELKGRNNGGSGT